MSIRFPPRRRHKSVALRCTSADPRISSLRDHVHTSQCGGNGSAGIQSFCLDCHEPHYFVIAYLLIQTSPTNHRTKKGGEGVSGQVAPVLAKCVAPIALPPALPSIHRFSTGNRRGRARPHRSSPLYPSNSHTTLPPKTGAVHGHWGALQRTDSALKSVRALLARYFVLALARNSCAFKEGHQLAETDSCQARASTASPRRWIFGPPIRRPVHRSSTASCTPHVVG